MDPLRTPENNPYDEDKSQEEEEGISDIEVKGTEGTSASASSLFFFYFNNRIFYY